MLMPTETYNQNPKAMTATEYDNLSKEVQEIINTQDEDKELYKECQRIQSELSSIGYACEYTLDGQIQNVRKVGTQKTILRTYKDQGKLMINKTVVRRTIGKGNGDLRPEPLEVKDVCLYLDKFNSPKAILMHRCLYLLSKKEITKANLISKELRKKHQIEISYPASWGSEVERRKILKAQKIAISVSLAIIIIALLIILR